MLIRNDDVELRVACAGPHDGPPVLLLHGITNCVEAWDWLVPDLADRYRVLRLDFRGHGDSARAPGAYDPTDFLSDAVAVCQQVAGRPCVVVGHSLGGVTAAGLAQRHPELVRALVLEDPPLTDVVDLGGNALREGFALLRRSVPGLQERGVSVPDLAASLGRAPSPTGPTFGQLLHDDALRSMATGLLRVDPAVLDPVLAGGVVTVFDPQRPLPVPTLVLAADPASPDAVVRPADAERLTRTSPLARVQVVTGAGHLVHDERDHRDTVRAAVLGFLAELDESR